MQSSSGSPAGKGIKRVTSEFWRVVAAWCAAAPSTLARECDEVVSQVNELGIVKAWMSERLFALSPDTGSEMFEALILCVAIGVLVAVYLRYVILRHGDAADRKPSGRMAHTRHL